MAAMQEPDPIDPHLEARFLLRASRVASLATLAAGQPHVALVTPAVLPDLSVLLLLSTLSAHTRQLAEDPLCALLVSGPATTANPQTAPRLSLTGRAARCTEPWAKPHFLAIHPYAALYADFGDFSIWRIALTGAHFVGGFARAARLDLARFIPDEPARLAVEQAASGVIAHCNNDHAAAMDAIAVQQGQSGAGWKMVNIDVDGFDLAREETVIRVPFAAPVAGVDELRGAIIRLARAASPLTDRG
jgi:putative heme iron utilization protein